ncbi:myelin protein zero-like protein 3 isoform X1 [Protobothrops mucrosquamatus]|uniref:myelin protein zero-like protein 3 isoform X1 n=1 Tax=Protobothrops mucrosquamatus TaxID=103944 RepID=UPI000775D68D|nr:myelin protein zero-like protein 3 isoform X1 [Protobothrops mucrosquamatus]
MGLARRKPVGAAALPLLLLAAARVHLLEIQAAAQVRAFVGEPVTLKCWFKSSAPVTEKLTVDWTYRPLAGGNLEPVFHYQSSAYPAKRGSFRDRVSWAGDVAKQDASIMIWNPTLEDNGTFTCSVKNPPDVQHNIPQTLLTVTQRGASFQLTSSGLFSILVFLPSGIVVILLLVRMNQKSGLMKARRQPGYKKSSIEVSEETPMRRNRTDTGRGSRSPFCSAITEIQLRKSPMNGQISFHSRNDPDLIFSLFLAFSCPVNRL